MTLTINAFYGNIQNLNAGEVADIQQDFHPFSNAHKGECPVWLKETVGTQITNGVTLPSPRGGKGRPRHIDGEQISRGVAYYGLLKQLELLRSLAKDIDCNIEARIARCGKIGRFALRFLVGLEGVKVNFINFPPEWTDSLQKLEPISKQTVYMRGQDYNDNVPQSRIVSFGDDLKTDEPKAVVEDVEVNDEPEEVVEKPKTTQRKKTPAKSTKAVEPTPEPVEPVVEEAEPEAEVVPEKPKRTTRKKAEPTPEPTEEVVEKPKRTPRKKAVAVASDDKLAELGSKFPTSTRK